MFLAIGLDGVREVVAIMHREVGLLVDHDLVVGLIEGQQARGKWVCGVSRGAVDANAAVFHEVNEGA